jgi:hypothetical protein
MVRENKIQASCFQYFHNEITINHPNCIMFSVPNELAGGNKMAMMNAKAMGLISGVSDTIIVLNHIVIFCEFKTDKGNQSEEQIKFEKRVNKYHHYWLIRDFETFKLKINEVRFKNL